jgi:hypothetical protein
MKVIPETGHVEYTWWRLFQQLVMWSIPDEGYSRYWWCGVYLLLSGTLHMTSFWNNLHQVCSTWPVSGITFIRYAPHDQFLE